MHCPQCKSRVGVRVLLTSNSLSGIGCARCGAELEPVTWTYAVVNAASILAGAGVSGSLRAAGYPPVAALGGLVTVYLAGFLGLAGTYLRLRAKQPATVSLGPFPEDRS